MHIERQLNQIIAFGKFSQVDDRFYIQLFDQARLVSTDGFAAKNHIFSNLLITQAPGKLLQYVQFSRRQILYQFYVAHTCITVSH